METKSIVHIIIENDNVIGFGKNLRYDENGNPWLVNEKTVFLGDCEVKIVDSIPQDFMPCKYCYTEEKGFYPNPDYVEPKSYNQEQYDAVIAELVTEGRL